MAKPLVAVASLGGTITMIRNNKDSAAVVPKLSAEDLIRSVPKIAEVADIVAETLSTVPGASLQFSDVFQALSWSREQADKGVDGIVLVQGTDTIEETAYLMDLYWDRQEPLVVTGAMRAPTIPGTDGPANLLASVQVAASANSRNLGVLVVMNDEIHAATRVRKTRSSGVDAFDSPSFGVLGFLEENKVVIGNRPKQWPNLKNSLEDAPPKVALVETYFGDDASMLELITDSDFDGVVVAGFGVGHVSPQFAKTVDKALRSCPVVLASRTGSGSTFSSTYGFEGSESDLISRGAIGAGWLDPRKARILLSCLLSAGFSRAEIRDEFLRRGAAANKPLVSHS